MKLSDREENLVYMTDRQRRFTRENILGKNNFIFIKMTIKCGIQFVLMSERSSYRTDVQFEECIMRMAQGDKKASDDL